MKATRTLILAAFLGTTLFTTGCSVVRGQESTGAYVDDAAITAEIKTKLIGDTTVNAGAINVQTLHGEVALSGFAKSTSERERAEQIAYTAKGVKKVRNNLVVRGGLPEASTFAKKKKKKTALMRFRR